MLDALYKAVPQLAIALAILGIMTAGAYTGHVSATLALGVIGTLIGLVGLVSITILNSPQPNSDLLPHLIFTLAVLTALTVLLFHSIITSDLMVTVLSPILGGGIVVAGASATSNAISSLVTKPGTPAADPQPSGAVPAGSSAGS